jgi:hypothetical protein
MTAEIHLRMHNALSELRNWVLRAQDQKGSCTVHMRSLWSILGITMRDKIES